MSVEGLLRGQTWVVTLCMVNSNAAAAPLPTGTRAQARPPARAKLAAEHAARAGQLCTVLTPAAGKGGSLAVVRWADDALGSYPRAWLTAVRA